MDAKKVLAVLNSDLRREILKIIAEQPMTAVDVFRELRKRMPQIKYRETVYRGLEKLFDASLVEKYYDREKGLCYKLLVSNLTIDLAKGTISGKTTR